MNKVCKSLRQTEDELDAANRAVNIAWDAYMATLDTLRIRGNKVRSTKEAVERAYKRYCKAYEAEKEET